MCLVTFSSEWAIVAGVESVAGDSQGGRGWADHTQIWALIQRWRTLSRGVTGSDMHSSCCAEGREAGKSCWDIVPGVAEQV